MHLNQFFHDPHLSRQNNEYICGLSVCVCFPFSLCLRFNCFGLNIKMSCFLSTLVLAYIMFYLHFFDQGFCLKQQMFHFWLALKLASANTLITKPLNSLEYMLSNMLFLVGFNNSFIYFYLVGTINCSPPSRRCHVFEGLYLMLQNSLVDYFQRGVLSEFYTKGWAMATGR